MLNRNKIKDMKKLLGLVLLVLVLGIVSCEKEDTSDPTPTWLTEGSIDGNADPDYLQPNIGDLLETDWRLVDAKMYYLTTSVGGGLANEEGGYFTHPQNEESSLRFGGAYIPLERIVVGETVWSFESREAGLSNLRDLLLKTTQDPDKEYLIEGARINEYHVGGVSGNLGGSARPITIMWGDTEKGRIDVKIHDSYLKDPDINVYYQYFNILTFERN